MLKFIFLLVLSLPLLLTAQGFADEEEPPPLAEPPSERITKQRDDSSPLKIIYDMRTRSYTLSGKQKVRKGRQVELEIINLNTYLFSVEATASAESFQVAPGSFSPGGGTGNPLSNLFGSLGFDGSLGEQNFSFETTGRGEEESNAAFRAKLKPITANIKASEALLAESYAELNRTASIGDAVLIASSELRMMKKQPDISHLKENLEMLSEAVFGRSEVDDLGIDDLMKYKNLLREAARITQQLTLAEERLLGELASLRALQAAFPTADEALLAEVALLERSAATLTAQVATDLPGIKANITQANFPSMDKFLDLRREIQQLQQADFIYRSSFVAEEDELTINVRLTADSLDSKNKVIDLPTLKVPVHGGIKINTSVGLNFGQYFRDNNEYFLKDGVVTSSEGDKFIPYVSTMLHFYPRSASEVTLGGSFGIGFPLAASESVESAPVFFLGSSLLFGKQDRLVLTGGLKGGKVRRLDRGFAVGDVVDVGVGDIPLKSVYELGAFLGLSFNLGGG